MDNSEDAQLCRFGTPLEPLEEDDVPSKKRVAIEDQIVTDENGKRRFHGAFTGGFSAGFWNTVGSLEGWKPQSFKSSRTEKAEKRQHQLPMDFMDDEDLGEFGIAPQRVQAREDFAKTNESANRKRKLLNRDSGPIPGIPVLQQLLEPSREKVSIRLLRRMGWKPGQGIGARQTRIEKTQSNERNNREVYVMKKYGCDMDPNVKLACVSEEISNSSDQEEEEQLTFAPDDFEPFVCSIKDNTFGLGYSGLCRQLATDSKSHITLFSPLEVVGKSNNVLSIRGQAFGVGALEEEDEDIYAKDDMSRYDFTLDNKNRGKKKLTTLQVQSVLEGFAEAGNNSNVQKTVHCIELRSSFQPRNWLQRKTRFEPLPEEKIAIIKQSDAYKKKGLGRHDLDPDERGSILDEHTGKSVEMKEASGEVSKKQTYLQHISEKYKEREAKSKKMLDLLSSKADNFVKGGLITKAGVEINSTADELSDAVKIENYKIISEAKEITKSLGKACETFRPFANNEAKQERYEKFIEANLQQDEEIRAFLVNIQPVHLSEWDREMERKEFVQARSIYKPLNGLMSERFVSKSNVNVLTETSKTEENKKANVIVQRTKILWKPCALICKRFNIAEPFGGTLAEPIIPKKGKFSVFDYIESSINSKKNFITPVIIPKYIEKPKAIQRREENSGSSKEKISTKDLLSGDRIDPSISKAVSEINDIQTRQTSIKNTNNLKTELELKVEESRNKHPSEKKDLFKCIFDSSSDDQSNHGDNSDDPINQDTSKGTVSDEIVKTLLKPSAPVNILRHDSPPRGIFAALFTNPIQKEETSEANKSDLGKVTFKPKRDRDVEQDILDLDDTYGPKLPTNFVTKNITVVNDNDIDKKLIELMSSSKSAKAAKVIESWVEKSDKSRKKGKTDKKTKDRKKKSKYKHKKSKKVKKSKK